MKIFVKFTKTLHKYFVFYRNCEFGSHRDHTFKGDLAHVGRASALHAEGQGFDSLSLHYLYLTTGSLNDKTAGL